MMTVYRRRSARFQEPGEPPMEPGVEKSPSTGADELHPVSGQAFLELSTGIEADDDRTHPAIGDADRQFDTHRLEPAAPDVENHLHNGW